MNTRILPVVVVALVIALAAPVVAQYEERNSSPLGVAITDFRPSGSHLQNLETNWIGANLYYHLKYDQLDRPTLALSVGWFTADTNSAGISARFIPLRLNATKHFGESEDCWYVGGGVDLVFANYKTGWGRTSADDAKLGFNLLVGREIGHGWYAEARRDFVGKLNHPTAGDIDFSGWSISLGSRFGY